MDQHGVILGWLIDLLLKYFFSGGANGPIEKWRSYKGKIHSGELSGGS